MSEIRFRAWNKKKKKYIYDIQNAYDTLGWNNEKCSIGYGCQCFGHFLNEEKENFVVEQYTGLKDRFNKQEVYEGDIILYYKDTVHLVKWNESEAKFEPNFHIILCGEVIGNIHENPELLK